MGHANAVYISFNLCEDTIRHSFLSHLAAGFHRRGISFNEPDRVPEVNDAAIVKSKVSLVILSKKYASSKGCLAELVKIFKCQESNGLVVVPVFYGLTKSGIKKECLKLKKMCRVARQALLELGDLPGHASSPDISDSELVEDIVADVRQTLDLTGKVGVYSRLTKIESLLRKQPWGVRSLGIWGMGGIGKTTLAEAAFEQQLPSGDFDASCIIKDFDNSYQEKGAYGLLEEHLGGKLGLTSHHITREKLRNKRILLVLDDVHKPLGATTFLGLFDLISAGSVIIITSRDKHLLVQCRVKEIYEVQGLNEHESLQLFSRCAFEKNVPDKNLLELSMKFVTHADGNRLALSVYGEELKGKKTLSEMETAARNLELCFPDKIFDVLKRSYDTLSDREKEVFLQIVFSFRGENVDDIMQFLAGCGFFPRVEIGVLVGKCLVTISENRVHVHSLIYKVGLKIIKDQTDEIGMRYRFLDASNIQSLLEDNEIREDGEPEAISEPGNEDVKAIILNTSNLPFKGHTSFQHMYSLRYLKIYRSSDLTKDTTEFRFPEDPDQSLPPELTLLHWENYPSQSFPKDFGVQHLVELNMPCSKLQRLWGGTKKLEMLKRITLSDSRELVNVDELQYSPNIELINLQGCSRLQSFPDMGQSKHLQVLNLSTCKEIKRFPKVPPSIKKLHLKGTDIRDLSFLVRDPFETTASQVNVSFSSQDLGKLVFLELKDCSHLKTLPNMVAFESLQVLDLSGCSEIDEIQGLPRSLKELSLAKTAIGEIPSSMCHQLSELVILDMEGCKMLQHLPKGMCDMKSLVTLKLSGCSKLMYIHDFPQNLKELYLAGTAIRELPRSIGNLAELDTLDLKNCKRLRSLPMEMRKLNPLKVLDLSHCSKFHVDTSFLPEVKELLRAGTGMSPPAPMKNEAKQRAVSRHVNTPPSKRFKSLPVEMRNFNPRKVLDLSDCSEIQLVTSSLPEVQESHLVRPSTTTSAAKKKGAKKRKAKQTLENRMPRTLVSGSSLRLDLKEEKNNNLASLLVVIFVVLVVIVILFSNFFILICTSP